MLQLVDAVRSAEYLIEFTIINVMYVGLWFFFDCTASGQVDGTLTLGMPRIQTCSKL